MYLSKYIRRCDFMDNMNTMDFNQKIDVSLRASLEATPVERNASDDLSTGRRVLGSDCSVHRFSTDVTE